MSKAEQQADMDAASGADEVEREKRQGAPVGACVGCGHFDCQCVDDDDGYDDEWACTFCGGEGIGEVDDPMWDDCDEYGFGDCSACGGTGLRKNQTIF